VCSNSSYVSFDLLLLQTKYKKKHLLSKYFCKILVDEAEYEARKGPVFDRHSRVNDLKKNE